MLQHLPCQLVTSLLKLRAEEHALWLHEFREPTRLVARVRNHCLPETHLVRRVLPHDHHWRVQFLLESLLQHLVLPNRLFLPLLVVHRH